MPIRRAEGGKFKKKRKDSRRIYGENHGGHPTRILVGCTRKTYALYRRCLLLHKLLYPTSMLTHRKSPSETMISRALADYNRWLKAQLEARGIDWRKVLEEDERHTEAAPETAIKRLAALPPSSAKLRHNAVDDRRFR